MGFMDEIGELFEDAQDEQKSETKVNVEEATATTTTVVEDTATVETTGETADAEATPGDEAPAETAPEPPGSDPVNETSQTTPATTTEPTGQVNLFGELTEEGCGCAAPKKKPMGAGGKKKEGAANGSASKTKPEKPKEPDQDMDRMVVITAQNERRTYPSEMTLEEIRVDIERDFPAFSKENTNWHFEKQEEQRRYLCIPAYKFNKAG